MKIFNLISIVLFVIFAALQYNDPDPYIWMPIYLFGAFVCFEAYRNRFNPVLYITGITVYLVYALYLFFNKTGVINWASEHNAENIAQSMKATKPWIEETREFFGLAILIAVLVINFYWLKNTALKNSH